MTASFHFVKIKLFDAVVDWRFLSLAVHHPHQLCGGGMTKSKSSLNDDFDFFPLSIFVSPESAR